MPISSAVVTGDGSRAVITYANSLTGSDNVYTYDAETAAFTSVPLALSGTASGITRTGALTLFNHTDVYDPSFSLLGKVPFYDDGRSCTTSEAVISPDGTRAYAYCTYGTNGRIYTYDLTAATVGGDYPAIGSYLAAPYLISNNMSISHDGKVLFLVGTTKMTVVPVP